MESKHNKWQKAKDNMPEEDILFCCTTCKFETIEEKNLTDHIKDKHENLVCEKCKANFRSRKQLQEHDQKEHASKGCDICNFKSASVRVLEEHVQNMHNKMYSCRECNFATLKQQATKY